MCTSPAASSSQRTFSTHYGTIVRRAFDSYITSSVGRKFEEQWLQWTPASQCSGSSKGPRQINIWPCDLEPDLHVRSCLHRLRVGVPYHSGVMEMLREIGSWHISFQALILGEGVIPNDDEARQVVDGTCQPWPSCWSFRDTASVY
jgi:hypothetical protein